MTTVKVYTARFGYRAGNSGDECSRYVIQMILPDREVLIESDPNRANLFAVGSVLDKLPVDQPGRRAVWGTGLIDENHRLHIPENDDVGFFALRGPLTARRVSGAWWGGAPDLGYGDPGILASLIWPELMETPKRYTLGIVAHYVDMDADELCVLVRRHGEGVTVIDPCAPLRDVLRGIAECEAVLSSSLHGLIFAESMRVPNAWLRMGDRVAGGSFKFRDWYAALNGASDALSISMTEAHGVPLDELASMTVLTPNEVVDPMRTRLRETLIDAVEWLDEEPEPEPEPAPPDGPPPTRITEGKEPPPEKMDSDEPEATP